MNPSSHEILAASSSIAEIFAAGRNHHLRPVGSGNSAAQVFVLEILGSESEVKNPGLPKSGRYILKISQFEDGSEISGEKNYQTALLLNEGSSYEIVPKLVKEANYEIHDTQYTAALFEVAGRSLDTIAASVSKLDERVLLVVPQLFSTMYTKWANKDVATSKSQPSDILQNWNGYRNDPSKAGGLHRFVNDVFAGKSLARYLAHVLLSPLRLGAILEESGASEIAHVSGFLHRDLHNQNVLFEYAKNPPKFWVIDFALSRSGPIGFDQAYFQLGQIISNLKGLKAGTVLGALDAFYNGGAGPWDMPEFAWILRLLKVCDEVEKEWVADRFPHWSEDVKKQLELARVAAGINWANKPLPDEARLLAVLYASYHATRFMKTHLLSSWEELIASDIGDEATDSEVAPISAEDWSQIWNLVGGFDPSLHFSRC